MNTFRFWAFFAVFLCPSAWAQPTHEFQLDNGLRIIVREDHRAPVVVSQVWYKVGSSYEHGGITGISHLLEHMMFKGTPKHPAGEFSRIISEHGGRENAFTGKDYTAYFQTLKNEHLEVSFELESDRMRNLSLPEEEFNKERDVVMEERRLRTEDNPKALAYERFNAIAYLNSPYRQPIIGWMTDLKALTLADLKTWYRTWYAPNNATLVVVGDVDPEEVLALARKYYGPLKPSVIPSLKPRKEVPHHGPRTLELRDLPAEVPYLIMGFPVPVLKTAGEPWEAYALQVVQAILDGGGSARFARHLVRGKEVAAAVSASYDLYARLDSQFIFDGIPADGHTLEDLEKALWEEIQALKEEPVSPGELQRVKTQVKAERIYARDSMFYQAMKIGLLVTVGLDWRLLDEWAERIQAVTPEQVMKVARKYFVRNRLTRAHLFPKEEGHDH
ncbi:MAG: insulinase family protein [Gammaproteobacteria bacterium]|nr:MAG: insulinase family protein [Gammaproteobacteria bacterium]